MAKLYGSNVESEGGRSEERTAFIACGLRWNQPAAKAMAAKKQIAATLHARTCENFGRAASGPPTPVCEPASRIHSSCSLRSCADWNLSSGSFAKQILTVRSSASGDIG